MVKTATESTGQKMISADCVSIIMAFGDATVSQKQLDMMSALDGNRTASSFQHEFRTITAKAKALKARLAEGEVFVAVKPPKKRGTSFSW